MKPLLAVIAASLFGFAVACNVREAPPHDQVYRAVLAPELCESGKPCEALIHHSRSKDEARKALVRHYGEKWQTATLTESESISGFVLSEKRTP